eukprot:TRINITY_DN24229_c0_g1_i1.p1 TRINITY_DN24229_c0_g1~~TRINITY_DN24229_c0_g1_i1.p1  ORF type:complete len:971 (-),score=221.94 TRINITY_DN24229_c0_g1_i1:349-3261(-)
MIAYGAKAGQPSWYMFFQVSGSVFPQCFMIVFPISILAVVLKVLHQEEVFGKGENDWVTGFYFLKDGSPWGGFSGFVVFVVVFRLSQAYSTYWAAYGTTNGVLGDWSGAAASAVAFCRHAKKDPATVEEFLHTIVRLFSMLSACALQELSPRKSHQVWGLLTLNAGSVDSKSLSTLDGSELRVDLCYHWIQQLIVDSQDSGLLAVPPPIVGRVLAELSAGMGKFGDAKKHATCQFNFPYAQTCKWLLVLYSIMMPLMMVRWSNWISGAFIFTFVQLFFIWTLEFITVILENPFDTSNPNCIDVFQLQLGMNSSLLLLLDPTTRAGPPKLDKDALLKYPELQKRDTVHKATLRKEGWKLKDESELKGTSPLDLEAGDAHTKQGCGSCCCCCRCSHRELDTPTEIAMSDRYCVKRFGIIDDEKTAVIAIGIFGDELIVALPPSCIKLAGQGFRRGLAMITVKSTSGRACQVAVKKIAISDRHKLHKTSVWTQDEYNDFPYEYQDLAHAIYLAARNIVQIRCIAEVRLQAELKAQKKIEEAKKADKDGLGIDQISKLKRQASFRDTLMKECGFDKDAAEAEWARRLAIPDEYEQEREEGGEVMIELDIAAFKKKLEEKKKAEEEAARLLETNRKSIVDAKSNGKIRALEAAIKKAELETHMTEEELDSARKLVQEWQEADKALAAACEKKHVNLIKTGMQAAGAVGLKNETCARAEKLLAELIVEEAQASLAAAKETGGIETLKDAIQEAEASMAGISEKGLKVARTLVQSWEAADSALKEASESQDGPALKKAVDVAVSLGLRSASLSLAKQVLQTVTAADREALEAAMSAGRAQVLQTAITEARAKGILPEDALTDAQQLLDKQVAAEQILSDALSAADPQQLEVALVTADSAKLHDEVVAAAKKALEAAKAAEAAQNLLKSPTAGGDEADSMLLPGESPKESEDQPAEVLAAEPMVMQSVEEGDPEGFEA